MGSGRFDNVSYSSSTSARALSKTPDFAYSPQGLKTNTIHPNLDPARIRNKPFQKLESRDSAEHPESNAVLVSFDVTGSNRDRAVEAQKKLPGLMQLLTKYLPDPQVSFAANDDIRVVSMPTQISDFESDNRIDEHLRNIILVGMGGGNQGESYDLILYAAARKTILDCFEKRNRKGYLFMYADEPFFPEVSRNDVRRVYGDELQADIPIEDIIAEAKKMYHVFVISTVLPLWGADKQYPKLFGKTNVLTLQDPSLISEMIVSVVGMQEAGLTDEDAVKDLVSVGTSAADAATIVGAVRRKFRPDILTPPAGV